MFTFAHKSKAMESNKTPRRDSRKGPCSLFIKDGEVTRRRPKHRPWNAAPKKRTWFNREGYGKKFGEYLINYDTVSRSNVKHEWKKNIEDEMDRNEGFTNYSVKCHFCGGEQILRLKDSDVESYQNGDKLVNQAFPYLTADEREILISGMCGKCFDEKMKPLEER